MRYVSHISYSIKNSYFTVRYINMSFFFLKHCINLFGDTVWQRFTFFLAKVLVTPPYTYCLYAINLQFIFDKSICVGLRSHQSLIAASNTSLFRQTFVNASVDGLVKSKSFFKKKNKKQTSKQKTKKNVVHFKNKFHYAAI